MKKYIVPSVEVINIETESHILSLSPNESVYVDPNDQNEIDRAKDYNFDLDVWGFNDEED